MSYGYEMVGHMCNIYNVQPLSSLNQLKTSKYKGRSVGKQ